MSFNNIITITHADAATIINELRGETILIRGEPGVGKTAMGEALSAQLGMPYVHVNCPSKADTSEFGMFVPNRETGQLEFMTNGHYAWDKPCIFNLDEYTKAMNAIKTMLHGLAEFPRRIGDLPIHRDSIVFLTGNLASDGVGDVRAAHSQNRMCELYMLKPPAEPWVQFAATRGINPIVLAWVTREPQVLASYLDDGQQDNPYIFNPKRASSSVNKAYVSPRSLFKASDTVTKYQEGRLTENQMMAVLQGQIGGAAMRQLTAFIAVANQIPTPREIINNPTSAPVPTAPGATVMVTLGAIQWLTSVATDKTQFDNLSGADVMGRWFQYMQRLEKELQAMFVITAKRAGDPTNGGSDGRKLWDLAWNNKAFQQWALSNMHLFKGAV